MTIALSRSLVPVEKVPGLHATGAGAIEPGERAALLELLKANSTLWTRAEGHYGTASRERMFFGFQLDATKTMRRAPPIPEVLREIARRVLPESASDPERFNQCIVNKYEDKQGIGSHIDNPEYGDEILVFCIGGKGVREGVTFTRGKESVKVPTPSGSVYYMRGEARRRWKHKRGPLKRSNHQTLYSFTIRSIIEK